MLTDILMALIAACDNYDNIEGALAVLLAGVLDNSQG